VERKILPSGDTEINSNHKNVLCVQHQPEVCTSDLGDNQSPYLCVNNYYWLRALNGLSCVTADLSVGDDLSLVVVVVRAVCRAALSIWSRRTRCYVAVQTSMWLLFSEIECSLPHNSSTQPLQTRNSC